MRHSVILELIVAGLAAAISVWLVMSVRYRVAPTQLVRLVARIAATRACGYRYRSDRRRLSGLVSRYCVGMPVDNMEPVMRSWAALESEQAPFVLIRTCRGEPSPAVVPFVYESQDAEYLVALRHKFHLDEIVKDARSEYEAILRLGAWLGGQWDHGTDPLVGTHHVCDPVATIEAGRQGAKYWCEIAARTTVHAFTSLGWAARIITGSRDGYTWEHAVGEVWSNEFDKWVLVDTDFNVVYENEGVPLSAWELCRKADELRTGGIVVRRFAPLKASLQDVDLLPFYEYIHVDLRNDWCSRRLRRGSPVGSDLATWWTARPSLGPLLTAARRVDEAAVFNWPVNQVAIKALGAVQSEDRSLILRIGLVGYSPVFTAFEVQLDTLGWKTIEGSVDTVIAAPGKHRLRARMTTKSGYPGPTAEVEFAVNCGKTNPVSGSAMGLSNVTV